MRDNGDHISVVYEHFIYVERVDELTQAFITKGYMQRLFYSNLSFKHPI